MPAKMAQKANTSQKTAVDWPLLVDADFDRNARVLLVEDDRSTRRLVSSALKDFCQLIEAPDASQGITAYNAFRPDIVFLDIALPDGDGHHLLDWIMRNDPGAFVVMFSGHNDTDTILKSVDTGAKGFVVKPFDVNKMLYFIRSCPRMH